MTQTASAAAAARETARTSTGQFGAQPRAEAELEFPIPSGSAAVDALLDARDDSLRAVDAATDPQADRDASALLQRQTAKLTGLGVPVDFPGATHLEIVQDFENHGYKIHQVLGADGTVLANEKAVEDYDNYLGLGFGGLAQVTYQDVADSFVVDHDSWIDDVAKVTRPSAREHAAITIDLDAAAQMDATKHSVVTEPELNAHLDAVQAAREAKVAARQAVEQATRKTVDLIARAHPSAARAQFSIQDEDSEPEEVVLYDAAGAQIPEHHFDETSLFESLDPEGLGVMRGVDIDFYNGSADYAIDLAAVRAAMEPRV